MDAANLLPHRTALIGAAVALSIGVVGGLVLKTGSQTPQETETVFVSDTSYAQAEPIAWPSGKVPDYVVGADFLSAQQPEQPPVVVASYDVPEYTPAAWTEPAPQPLPVRSVRTEERAWPSTGGDILNTRLPEDAPTAPEPPRAIEALGAPSAPEPGTLPAAS